MATISTSYLFLKRSIDILCSIVAIILLLPVYFIISVLVLGSIGAPILYTQERLGKGFKPFKILKFRTMSRDAEKNGEPQLSSEKDDRVVGVGRVLRKYRLDELPQFFNVLLGHMSIVGPRPERDFYIKQLQEQVPEYNSLFQVKPGITSSGMVEFGYASNVEEMKKRAVYDISYMKTFGFKTDWSVLIKTILVVINGKGK